MDDLPYSFSILDSNNEEESELDVWIDCIDIPVFDHDFDDHDED